jgi:hypothetical protein
MYNHVVETKFAGVVTVSTMSATFSFLINSIACFDATGAAMMSWAGLYFVLIQLAAAITVAPVAIPSSISKTVVFSAVIG